VEQATHGKDNVDPPTTKKRRGKRGTKRAGASVKPARNLTPLKKDQRVGLESRGFHSIHIHYIVSEKKKKKGGGGGWGGGGFRAKEN